MKHKTQDVYEKFSSVNIIREITSRGFKQNAKGKVKIPVSMEPNYMWLHSNRNEQNAKRDCNMWLHILCNNFNIVPPKECLGCWKTFCRINTLRELNEIFEFQRNESRKVIDIPCKCGGETRDYTGNIGGYAAFWYNPLGCELDEARENTRRLSRTLGRELKLKRGCTEMEIKSRQRYGVGSDRWEELRTPQVDMKEKMILDIFELEHHGSLQPTAGQELDVWQRLIEFAAFHGDETYRDFCSFSLISPILDYTRSDHEYRNNGKSTGRDEESKLIETLEEN
jgi:hypothetical protein